MALSRRWFQFSLRGFLVTLTIACLWLGWKVERARKRERAIDAIFFNGGRTTYKGGPRIFLGSPAHFWLDLQGVPVFIDFSPGDHPSSEVGLQLSKVYEIERLDIAGWSETELGYVQSVDDGCEVVVNVSPEGHERLQRKLPHCKVVQRYGQ